MNLHLENASVENISEIQQLAEEIWHAHYTDIIGKDQVEYMLGRFYSTEAMKGQMLGGQQFYCVRDGDLALGFAAVESHGGGKYFLNKLYMGTERQRGGMASWTMKALRADLGDVIEMRLQVNRQNYKAINFYFKEGFVIEKVADFDIGDGYFMNDFVMLWRA